MRRKTSLDKWRTFAYSGSMKASELKEWMKKNEKKTVDVASASRVSYRTLERFLSGKHTLSPLAEEAIRRLVYGDKPTVS